VTGPADAHSTEQKAGQRIGPAPAIIRAIDLRQRRRAAVPVPHVSTQITREDHRIGKYRQAEAANWNEEEQADICSPAIDLTKGDCPDRAVVANMLSLPSL